MTTLKCSTCQVHKDVSEFHKNKSIPRGYGYTCKLCKYEYEHQRRLTDPDYVARTATTASRWRRANKKGRYRRSRNSMLRHRYGIGIDEYEAMLERQSGECAICGRADSGIEGKTLHVDHCHETGKVRGILCHPCNNGLGRFDDNKELLLKAVKYLEENG